jgi:hypothetical protein
VNTLAGWAAASLLETEAQGQRPGLAGNPGVRGAPLPDQRRHRGPSAHRPRRSRAGARLRSRIRPGQGGLAVAGRHQVPHTAGVRQFPSPGARPSPATLGAGSAGGVDRIIGEAEVAPPLKGGDLQDSAASDGPGQVLAAAGGIHQPQVGELDGGMVARSQRQCCECSKLDSPYERMFE